MKENSCTQRSGTHCFFLKLPCPPPHRMATIRLRRPFQNICLHQCFEPLTDSLNVAVQKKRKREDLTQNRRRPIIRDWDSKTRHWDHIPPRDLGGRAWEAMSMLGAAETRPCRMQTSLACGSGIGKKSPLFPGLPPTHSPSWCDAWAENVTQGLAGVFSSQSPQRCCVLLKTKAALAARRPPLVTLHTQSWHWMGGGFSQNRCPADNPP